MTTLGDTSRICNRSDRPPGTIATEDMRVPVLTGANGRLAMTETIGQKTVEARPVSTMSPRLETTPDDSRRLQTTQEGNKFGTRRRIISQLERKSCAISRLDKLR